MIVVFLAVGSAIFSKTTNDLVITPIENMIAKVHGIAENPLQPRSLQAAQDMEERTVAEELQMASTGNVHKKNGMMETKKGNLPRYD